MRRSLELSLALLFGCWFVGLVWEAESVQPPAPAASIAQLDDGACDTSTDYWTLFAAASAAE